VLLALVVSFVLALAWSSSVAGNDDKDKGGSDSVSQSLGYVFKVHALNSLSRFVTSNGTIFRFDGQGLPFDFASLKFGDYREDTTFSQRYYGGSGMLVNASGGIATITLREGNGRFVTSVTYQGQSQLVFNGKVESVTYPNSRTTYVGTDQMIQDWRARAWTPNEGALLEHPANLTLTDAKFFVMTMEPSGLADIPEYELLPVLAACVMIVLVAARIKKREH
jgi:hypothetical protein